MATSPNPNPVLACSSAQLGAALQQAGKLTWSTNLSCSGQPFPLSESQQTPQHHPSTSFPAPTSTTSPSILTSNPTAKPNPTPPDIHRSSPTMAEAAFKPEKDYTKEVDKQIPEAETLAQVPSFCSLELAMVVLTTLGTSPTSMAPSKSSPCSRSRRVRYNPQPNTPPHQN